MSPNEHFTSQDSLTDADRTINEFSKIDGALGQAGVNDTSVRLSLHEGSILARPGDQTVISPTSMGFGEFYIGCSWNVRKSTMPGPLGWMGLKRTRKVDLDLGCLYELNDGTRGGLQALGAENGSLEQPPFIWLSHDERTGKHPGDDEFIRLNGVHWPAFHRVLIYTYIYEGAADWSDVAPDLSLKIPGQQTIHVHPMIKRADLSVCAIALIEQIRGGIKITNLTEYFPGQAEMDRAYGFGVQWADGAKE